MKPSGRLKLVSQLLDLPLIDRDGNYCGIVDDVELDGAPGKKTRLAALLVGPGAYSGRMPGWAMRLVRTIGGDRITRVPIGKVESIRSFVQLKDSARKLGLEKTEDKARAWIPRRGAL
jgi:sporulation protein YlmC with PRC-barrel domain